MKRKGRVYRKKILDMSLGNWDHIGCDRAGNFCSELDDKKVEIELYKNWLYVRCGGVLSEVYEGNLKVGEWLITAVRGPQEGIYTIVFKPGYCFEDKKDRGAVLIGFYGWEDEEFVGLTRESNGGFKDQVRNERIPQPWCFCIPEGLLEVVMNL